MSIAWVFPGQGSQKLGMAEDLLSLPGAKERFDFASQLIGRDLLEICRKSDDSNPSNDLNDTRNTQPALFVVESLLVDDLLRQRRKAELVAGHSLGEFVALYAAKVFDAKSSLRLLKRRSELMASAGGGAMTALIGFERQHLEDLVSANEGVVIANDNSSSQIVLSGTPQAVKALSDSLQCKRAIPLQVSGAFHSPYMESARIELEDAVNEAKIETPSAPIYQNYDAIGYTDTHKIRSNLISQLTSPVRWTQSVNNMIENNVKKFIECGPGRVLQGLVKKINRETDVSSL